MLAINRLKLLYLRKPLICRMFSTHPDFDASKDYYRVIGVNKNAS